jgi:hypothetical protein
MFDYKYEVKYGTYYMRVPLAHKGDDLGYAQYVVEKLKDAKCCYCMNPAGEHTAEELAACLKMERDREICLTCGRPDENHLDKEYSKCIGHRPVLKKATVSHIKQ